MKNRRARVEHLLKVRHQIDAELEQIENEIRGEMAATKLAKEAARRAEVRVPRRSVARCGTDGGYYRHRRRLGEAACDACKLAHRVAESERYAARRADGAA